MRIAFLTSTPLEFARGSGTFTGISTLARALEALGAEVALFTPARHFPVYTFERLWFNRGLRPAQFRAFDAVIGFDLDGYRVAAQHTAPHVAALKGVIADEMRFERGLTRRTMAVQAARERLHVERADLVLTTSRYSAERARQLYGLRELPSIVPECIDLDSWCELFTRNIAVPDPARFTVLTVSRFYPRKRLDVLLRAAATLRADIPKLEVRIVGGGPEETRLLNLWRSLRLDGTVRWLGNVSQDTVAREYQSCDVFCLPSLQEGFGIVFLEAMAAGKPIVAARAAAAPEVVTDGVLGLLAEPGSEESLAAAMRRLYADAALRESMGRAARAAVQQYHAPRIAARFLELLNRLAAPAGRPHY